MTEAEYGKKLRAAVKERFGDRCVFLKIHGGPRQEAGISDLLLCVGGHFVAIELKQKGKRATDLQEQFMHRVRVAGGSAFIAYTYEPLTVILQLLEVYEQQLGGQAA